MLISLSQKIAFTGQAFTQFPQPMHFSRSRVTPPPLLATKASVGQTLEHGGSKQALHTTTTNPCSMPPTDLTCIVVLPSPPTENLREHANIQSWQPTHLFTSITASLLTKQTKPPRNYEKNRTFMI